MSEMPPEIRSRLDLMGRRLEAYYEPARYTALVRRHLKLGTIVDVQEAIQSAMYNILQRTADGAPDPDDLEAFLNKSIRNALFDNLRRSSKAQSTDDLGDVLQQDRIIARAVKEWTSSLHIEAEEQLEWKALLRAIFSAFPEKYVGVATLAMMGESPDDIGSAYGSDGYVLRRYARQLVCRVLRNLEQQSHALAATMATKLCTRKNQNTPARGGAKAKKAAG